MIPRQTTAEDRVIATSILLAFELLSHVILQLAPRDHWYFMLAAFFNYLIVRSFLLVKDSWLSRDLLKLNCAALVVQFIGWILFESYFSSSIYNNMIHTLSMIQVVRIFWIENNENIETDSDSQLVRGHFNRLLGKISQEKA